MTESVSKHTLWILADLAAGLEESVVGLGSSVAASSGAAAPASNTLSGSDAASNTLSGSVAAAQATDLEAHRRADPLLLSCCALASALADAHSHANEDATCLAAPLIPWLRTAASEGHPCGSTAVLSMLGSLRALLRHVKFPLAGCVRDLEAVDRCIAGHRKRSLAGWRDAACAHRDARLVHQAAREGRPLELAKRLRLGVRAGGLTREYDVGGRPMRALEAARLGGHEECVKLLQTSMVKPEDVGNGALFAEDDDD